MPAQTAYPSEVVRGTFFEHDLPIKQMFVHFRTEPGGYARPLRVTRVHKLMAAWDRQAVGVLLLSMRPDGRFAIIDGQHRKEAASMVGCDKLDAMVFIDLSLEDEARLYRKFGDYLKQTALDRYHAGIAERVPEYLAIQAMLDHHGLLVPNAISKANGTVSAVDGLISIATKYGPDLLRHTLALLHDTWQGEHMAYRHAPLMGTAMFLVRFRKHPNYSRTRLIERMQKEGIVSIERRANNYRSAAVAGDGATGWGMGLLAIHDFRHSSTALGDWPRRHISEENKAKMSANLRDINENLTPEERTARAVKGHARMTPEAKTARGLAASRTRRNAPSPRDIACPYCAEPAGKPCINQLDNPIDYYHKTRKDALAHN